MQVNGFNCYWLYEQIREVKPGEFVIRVTKMTMRDDGSLEDRPETEDEKFAQAFMSVYTLQELGAADVSEFPSILAAANSEEVGRANRNLAMFKVESGRYPASDDIQKAVAFHERIMGRYLLWFKTSGHEFPVELEEKAIDVEQRASQGDRKGDDLGAGEQHTASGERTFEKGYLKRRIQSFAMRDNCKIGVSVPTHVITRWVNELRQEDYPVTENMHNSIRATLSDLGYSTERRNQGT